MEPKTKTIIKTLTIDVMTGDRFYCTLRMPITPDVIIGHSPEGGVNIDPYKIAAYVEEKRPTLKYKDYQIYV